MLIEMKDGSETVAVQEHDAPVEMLKLPVAPVDPIVLPDGLSVNVHG